jgi:hypothetical protein
MWWCEVDVRMEMMARETIKGTARDSSIQVRGQRAEFGARQTRRAKQATSAAPPHQLELELSGHVIVHCTMRTLLHSVSSVLHCYVTMPIQIRGSTVSSHFLTPIKGLDALNDTCMYAAVHCRSIGP